MIISLISLTTRSSHIVRGAVAAAAAAAECWKCASRMQRRCRLAARCIECTFQQCSEQRLERSGRCWMLGRCTLLSERSRTTSDHVTTMSTARAHAPPPSTPAPAPPPAGSYTSTCHLVTSPVAHLKCSGAGHAPHASELRAPERPALPHDVGASSCVCWLTRSQCSATGSVASWHLVLPSSHGSAAVRPFVG